MEERADAAGDRQDAEQQAESRERHPVAVDEEEVHERKEAARAEAEQDLDREEPSNEIVAGRRLEGVLRNRHGADREDRHDRSRRDNAAASDESAEHERVFRASAEQRGDRRRERTGDHAREERGGRAERDLLTEARGAPCGVGRVGEKRGARRARNDAAEADEHRRQKDRHERVEDEDSGDAEPGQRPANQDRGSARATSREDRRGDRAANDAERLRAGQKTNGERVEAERPVEKVQVELRDTQAEAPETRRNQVEDGIAPSEGRSYCAGCPRITSTVISLPPRISVSFTLSPGRFFTRRLDSGWSASIT